MKTIAQVLPEGALNEVIAQAPQGMSSQDMGQFKAYLGQMDSKQIRNLNEELKSAARTRARKIMLRESLLQRLGTDWLRKQQEMVEAELAKIEVAKDVHDFNILELELSAQTWRLDKSTNVLRLSEQAATDPLINLIKRQESEQETEVLGNENAMDDATMEALFEIK
jgi:hypothetical protein